MPMTLELDYLRSTIKYDPETGDFTRIKTVSHNAVAGQKAGFKMSIGYWGLNIKKRLYYCHRLAFFYMEGRWPEEIDHIDGNPLNNKWSNLREVNSSQNKANKRQRKDAKHSQYKGVCQTSCHNGVWSGKWSARVGKDKKSYYLGCFDSEIEAAKAYDEKAKELFGEHAKTNF